MQTASDSRSAPMRALLGFVAAALSVLTFHQATWALFHALGLLPIAPYPIDPVPPLGVPRIANACFWGGLYGAVYGLVLPRLPRVPTWLSGLGLGAVAVLVLWAVVLPLKGQPPPGGLVGMFVFAVIHCVWGIGTGVILPLLLGRRRPASAYA